MKSELIFIPLPAAGHMASAMQLGKLLLSRDDELSIRIIVLNDGSPSSSFIKSLYAETTQGIQFTEIPKPQAAYSPAKPENPFLFLCKLMDSYKPQVRDFVSQLKDSGSCKLMGLVIDMFTTEMIEIAKEFELPAYVFYTSGAATLGLWNQRLALKDEISRIRFTEYRGSTAEFPISTFKNPVPAKLLPSVTFEEEGLALLLKINSRIMQTKGIMVNTFLELESFALKSLAVCPGMPPVYPIGPLINFTGMNTNCQETQTIMGWLDGQPDSSVVFLCFGSGGFFEAADQVNEIANALENSGCRFLWSLRRPQSENPKQQQGSDYEFHEEMLPEGFLQRTAAAGVGKVIGWAPQVDVLGHPAVGGFVTHCGWNSVLESVWFGVPMAAWPMYAEQQLNAWQIVKDIGIAVEIKMDYNMIDPMMNTKASIVKAEEIENGITKLMMQPENDVKKNVKELKGKARTALLKGGSSYISLGSLMELLRRSRP